MPKIHVYSPITHLIALFQILKRNYAVNGHEMYCTCVTAYSLTCALLTMDTYSHRVANSKRFHDKMQCGLHYNFIVQTVFNANDIFSKI